MVCIETTVVVVGMLDAASVVVLLSSTGFYTIARHTQYTPRDKAIISVVAARNTARQEGLSCLSDHVFAQAAFALTTRKL